MLQRILALFISLMLLLSMLGGCTPSSESSASSSEVISSSETSSVTAPESSGEETVSLKDDFYEAVNAEWLANAELPADQAAVGGFTDLATDIEETLMADFADMLSGSVQPESTAMQNFIDFYRMATDFEGRDALGTEPMQPYLARVETLGSLADLESAMPDWALDNMPLPFTLGVMADMGNAQVNALYAQAPTLILPDVSYYADDNPTGAALLDAFSQMMQTLLGMAGKTEEEAAAIVESALAFDRSLVPYIKTAEESSDVVGMYNPMTTDEFYALSKNLDLSVFIEGVLGEKPDQVIVTDPKYFAAIDEIVSEETFESMKNWMLISCVSSFSDYLSEDFRLAASSYSMLMSARPSRRPKRKAPTIWRRAASAR